MPSSHSPRRKRIRRRASSSAASTTRWSAKNTPFNSGLRFPQARRDSSQSPSNTPFDFSPEAQSEASDTEEDRSPPLTADDRILLRRQSFPTAPEQPPLTYASLPPTPISTSPPRNITPPPASHQLDTRSDFQRVTPQNAPRETSPGPPFSLWDYLREELLATDFDSHQELKWERVSNFLGMPYALEKVRLIFASFVLKPHDLKDFPLWIYPMLRFIPVYIHNIAYSLHPCTRSSSGQHSDTQVNPTTAFSEGRHFKSSASNNIHYYPLPSDRCQQNLSFYSWAGHYQTVCDLQRT